jgi:hypothetical protein
MQKVERDFVTYLLRPSVLQQCNQRRCGGLHQGHAVWFTLRNLQSLLMEPCPLLQFDVSSILNHVMFNKFP